MAETWPAVKDEPSMTQPMAPAPRKRRRSIPWSIILPFSGGVLAIVLMLIVALAAGRTAPIADILLTLFVLCPLVICLLPLYLIGVVLITLMGRANQGVDGALTAAGRAADAAEGAALNVVNRAAKASITFNAAFARWQTLAYRLLNPHHPESKP